MNKIHFLIFVLVTTNSFAQKTFHQPNAKGEWQYIYPFKDKSYVLAIQFGMDEKDADDGVRNSNIYFGKTGIKADKIFWKENIDMRLINDNITYEDYNNDGVKDLLIFEDTGARGGNAYYNLYLINDKKYTLTKVKDFNKIVSPSYNKKHKVIVSVGLTATIDYQLYRLDKNNKPYKIGKSFEDTEALDFDKKLAKILSRNKKQSQEIPLN